MSEEKTTLKSIIKTQDEIESLGYVISNNIIERVNVNTIGHFNNTASFEMMCDCICPISGYNNTSNVGYLIRAFIELFGIEEEDGLRLDEIKNVPCRLVYNNTDCSLGGKCVGFGHFKKDKFVLTNEFIVING